MLVSVLFVSAIESVPGIPPADIFYAALFLRAVGILGTCVHIRGHSFRRELYRLLLMTFLPHSFLVHPT